MTTGPTEGRILLIDDHATISQSLAFALEAEMGEVVLSTHEIDPDKIAALAERVRAQVAVVDLNLGVPGRGLLVVARLRAIGLRVVLLTASTDPIEWAQAIEVGAEAVWSKVEPLDVIADGLRRALADEPLLEDHERTRFARILAEARIAADERALPPLTPREREVLAAMVRGEPAKQIARELGIAVPTVRSMIRNLFAKLGVNNQRAAVARALRAGFEA